MTLLEQAKQYAHEDGFSVFPLVPGEKKPFKRWNWNILQKRKPTDAELEAWFTKSVNVAVVTGDVSGGLFVLDFDDMDVFTDWDRLTGIKTRTVTTGKGVHLYFYCQEGFTGKFYVNGVHGGEGRFNGGYVVAPPSVHPSGRLYQWIDHDVPVMSVNLDVLHVAPHPPNALAQGKACLSLSQAGTRPPRRTRPGISHPEKYAQAVLTRECAKIVGTREGQRNSTLYQTACHVLRKFADVLPGDEMTSALMQAGIDAGLPVNEAMRTVQSAGEHL